MSEMQTVKEHLASINTLCDSSQRIPKHVQGQLGRKCQELCTNLEQYEQVATPESIDQYQTAVIECLKCVKDMIQKWSKRIRLGRNFEAEFNNCHAKISGCITSLALAHMQAESSEENREADHGVTMEECADPDFVEGVRESGLDQDDIREISKIMQRGLAEPKIASEEKRKNMAKNLYRLLQMYKRLPPECQLNSGEVQRSGAGTLAGGGKTDFYKGRFLESEDVRIKAIRSVNPDNEKIKMGIKREVELWAETYERDQGKHLIPFYGFYIPDGLCLALVSPWMNCGDALAYVKERDNTIDYKKLIVGIAEGLKFLHSNDPPIIHGSLKAANVLIGDQGQPLISDFALAKLQGGVITRLKISDYRWRAPEILRFEVIASAKGDIYSFGMTILELFTHEKPFSNLKSTFRVLSKKLGKDGTPDCPLDKRVIERGLNDKMWRFLSQCWSNDPKDRPSITDGRVDEIIYHPHHSERNEFPFDTTVEAKDFTAVEGNVADNVSVKRNNVGKFMFWCPCISAKEFDAVEGNVADDVSVKGNKRIENRITQTSKEELPFQSLLQILGSEQSGNSTAMNQGKINLVHKLLSLPDHADICSKLSNSDVELLLDFILSLLRDCGLANSGIQQADRKALRKLMFKLITVKDVLVLPKSLFMTDVVIFEVIGTGGFGRVFRGEHKGKQVAVKVVDKIPESRLATNGFCREALAWRSLAHRFIIPLLGIYEIEEKSMQMQYLVSPLMENGTLTEWRKKPASDISEIPRLMWEVVEGMQYLHWEGIVHGDLHGRNVLLDSKLHCQITDFGLIRHSEATTAVSTVALAVNFAAPELFGSYPDGSDPDCNGSGQSTRSKTLQTDVYAFGCLYYAIFFDTVPFQEANPLAIILQVADGKRPSRLEIPSMEDNTWDLIGCCWDQNPSKRPTMEQIVNKVALAA